MNGKALGFPAWGAIVTSRRSARGSDARPARIGAHHLVHDIDLAQKNLPLGGAAIRHELCPGRVGKKCSALKIIHILWFFLDRNAWLRKRHADQNVGRRLSWTAVR